MIAQVVRDEDGVKLAFVFGIWSAGCSFDFQDQVLDLFNGLVVALYCVIHGYKPSTDNNVFAVEPRIEYDVIVGTRDAGVLRLYSRRPRKRY